MKRNSWLAAACVAGFAAARLGAADRDRRIEAPVAALLTTATTNVVATPDPDRWFFTRAADWLTVFDF